MAKPKKELKEIQMSFRMTRSFHRALSTMAAVQMRSQAGMLEVIMRDYLARHPLEVDEGKGRAAVKKKVDKKR